MACYYSKSADNAIVPSDMDTHSTRNAGEPNPIRRKQSRTFRHGEKRCLALPSHYTKPQLMIIIEIDDRL